MTPTVCEELFSCCETLFRLSLEKRAWDTLQNIFVRLIAPLLFARPKENSTPFSVKRFLGEILCASHPSRTLYASIALVFLGIWQN